MAGNRAAAMAELENVLEKILPGGGIFAMYKARLDPLSDVEFEQFIIRLETGEERLAVVAPNFGKVRLEVERNLEVAKEWGHNFFESIRIETDDDTPPYYSNDKYLVVLLPIRRQAQLLSKKISVPEDSNSIDIFSGQAVGSSRGSSISYPESQILRALGLPDNQEELLKLRGGDVKGNAALNASISRTGGASMTDIRKLGTEVTSTRTLSTLLTSMHIGNSL